MWQYFVSCKEPSARNFRNAQGRWDLTSDVKSAIYKGLNEGNFTARQLTDQYKLPRHLISRIKTRGDNNFSFHDGKGGRPIIFTDDIVQSQGSIIREEKYKPKWPAFVKSALDAVNVKRQTEGNLFPLSSVSESSIRRFERRMTAAGFKRKIGDCGTNAREQACSSKLSALSFAAMCNAYIPTLKCKDQCANVDSTTFEASGSKNEFEVISEARSSVVKTQVDPDSPDENNLKFSVRKYVCGSASGHTTEAVYMFADSRMGEEDFANYDCAGLGSGTDLASKGHIVFCNSRAGNRKFYNWWLSKIYIPFVQQLRELNQLSENDIFLLSEDGEQIQIDMLIEQSEDARELSALLWSNKVVVVKLSASTTEIEQAMDNSCTFKAPKTATQRRTER